MIFTIGQLVGLIIFTEIMIYAALVTVTNTIKHCATARAYRKAMEKGVVAYNNSWFKDFRKKLEVKENENK